MNVRPLTPLPSRERRNIPLSAATTYVWRHATSHGGSWWTAVELANEGRHGYRTVARIASNMAAFGLLEARKTWPRWTYCHRPEMRDNAPEIATILDSLL